MNFLERLKWDLTGDAGARFALMNDFEDERARAAGEPKPTGGSALVQRREAERRLRELVEARA